MPKSKEKKNQNSKLDLKLEIKDFGPISSGKIDLKPLTIFVGPNNSGKSYAALLIHSIFKSHTPVTLSLPFFSRIEYYQPFIREVDNILKQIDRIDDEKTVLIPETLTKKMVKHILKKRFLKVINNNITKAFGASIKELVKFNRESFKFNYKFGSNEVCLFSNIETLKLTEYPKIDFGLKIIGIGGISAIKIIDEIGTVGLLRMDRISNNNNVKDEKLMLINELIEYISQKINERFNSLSINSYYLPAARSGITQNYKILAHNIIQQMAGAKETDVGFSNLTGIYADLISSLIEMTEKKSPMYYVAEDLEKEIIQGKIYIKILESKIPDIKYLFQSNEVSLQRASSSVSELVLLFLYLKYCVQPGNMLIIDEPEAHLHPENQRILAKYLVRLIRGGVNILITTHSDYLIDQLNNFIMLSSVNRKKRIEKYKYRKDDYLKHDEVAAYVFKYDGRNHGFKINPLGITEKDGISEDEFSRIVEVIYDETIMLRKDTED